MSYNKHIEELLELENISYSLKREIIQSLKTSKITRTFFNNSQLLLMDQILNKLNLYYYISDKKYEFIYDKGKGGYSNGYSSSSNYNNPNGYFKVHIGKNQSDVINAKSEFDGDDSLLAKFLKYQLLFKSILKHWKMTK